MSPRLYAAKKAPKVISRDEPSPVRPPPVPGIDVVVRQCCCTLAKEFVWLLA
jgi:hypothetical protein